LQSGYSGFKRRETGFSGFGAGFSVSELGGKILTPRTASTRSCGCS
jgi:hypothetical protein